ncbi:beta-alanyl-bioamine nonribosomal peptide synthetase ebony isoform X1 [Centruroides vittatus]|uniref:beta-alanyl-bioamine nonribosomal peptide synthetase ebony isoform X1 n=1 Tax=Centruroides vittatus TaxID=120091 RepID=UPI003510AC3C
MDSARESYLIGEDVPLEETRMESLFEETATREDKENELAIIENDKCLTFSELRTKINILASYLYGNSDKKSDKVVGIFMDVSIGSVISILAVFQMGATYVPLDPRYPKKRIEYISEKSNMSCILTTTSHFTLLKSHEIYLPIYDVSVILQHSTEINTKLTSRKRSQNLSCLIFTSGSTGNPKGVRLGHYNLLNRLTWQWRNFPFVSNDRVSAMKSLTFIDSLTEFLPALLKGVTVVIVPASVKNNPKELLKLFCNYKVTRTVVVPTLLNMILTHLATDQRLAKDVKVNLWISSGESLTRTIVFKFFQHFSSTLVNLYGSTEVTGDVTCKVISYESSKDVGDVVSIGRPIDNTAIYVLNENQDLVKHGDYGEICVSGLNVALGYKGISSEKFVSNPLVHLVNDNHKILYKTGDYGYVQEGEVYYVGRVDNQVKIKGVKVHLSEIELALESISIVSQSVVCCINRETNPQLVCFCVLHKNGNVGDVIAILKTLLPSEMIPRVVIKKELAVLVSGKIDKLALVEEYQKSTKCHSSNEILKIINDILQLKIDEKICEKTFYELGGTSVNAVEALARLHSAGYPIQNPMVLRILSLNELGELSKDRLNYSDEKNTTVDFRMEEISEKIVFGEVAKVIAESFVNKNVLDLIVETKVDDHVLVMERMWKRLVDEKFSFVVKNKRDDIIGVMLNLDFFDEPQVEIPERLLPIHCMHEVLEDGSRKNLQRSGKKWMHNIMLATALSLSPAENVQVVIYMEKQLLTFARSRGFHGVFTINSSKITQVICEEMLGYQIMSQYKVQNYVYRGKKVFEEAPSDAILSACYKYL